MLAKYFNDNKNIDFSNDDVQEDIRNSLLRSLFHTLLKHCEDKGELGKQSRTIFSKMFEQYQFPDIKIVDEKSADRFAEEVIKNFPKTKICN